MDFSRRLLSDAMAVLTLIFFAGMVGAIFHPEMIFDFHGGVREKVRVRETAAAPSVSTPFVDLNALKPSAGFDAVLLDARPEIFFEAGHIPGARSLPKDDFAARFEALKPLLMDFEGRRVIVYCTGGDCEDSGHVVAQLRAKGFTNLAIYEGGWEEWVTAGQPEERGKGARVR